MNDLPAHFDLITTDGRSLDEEKISLIDQVLAGKRPISDLNFDSKKFKKQCKKDKETNDLHGWFSLTCENLAALVKVWIESQAEEEGCAYEDSWYIPKNFIKYLGFNSFVIVYAYLCKVNYKIAEFRGGGSEMRLDFTKSLMDREQILNEYLTHNNYCGQKKALNNFLNNKVKFEEIYGEFQDIIITPDSTDFSTIMAISDCIKLAKVFGIKPHPIKTSTSNINSRYLEMEEDYNISEESFNREIEFLVYDIKMPDNQVEEIVNNFKDFFEKWYERPHYYKYLGSFQELQTH
jgi:hypothetical protein